MMYNSVYTNSFTSRYMGNFIKICLKAFYVAHPSLTASRQEVSLNDIISGLLCHEHHRGQVVITGVAAILADGFFL